MGGGQSVMWATPQGLCSRQHTLSGCALDATRIPDHDLLTAGFPCQAFSHAGSCPAFAAASGQLFFEVVRVLRAKRPDAFLLGNAALCPKPYVALTQGVTMGFGLGLAAYGRSRVVTESTQAAMPECGVGLFPDAGFSHVACRMPTGLGLYLALTGARLSTPAQLLHSTLGTHYVPDARVADLLQAMRLRDWRATAEDSTRHVLGLAWSRFARIDTGALVVVRW